MLLYSTTTTDRASKGQGGNKFLDVDIQAGKDRVHLLQFTIEYKEGESDKYGARVSAVRGDNLAILYNLQSQVNQAINEIIGKQRKT